jgi:hypothetical protein
MKWLKTQSEVDARRIMVSGRCSGGIQTLLTEEKGLGARAFIAFAPVAQSWGNRSLDQMLEYAATHAKAGVGNSGAGRADGSVTFLRSLSEPEIDFSPVLCSPCDLT